MTSGKTDGTPAKRIAVALRGLDLSLTVDRRLAEELAILERTPHEVYEVDDDKDRLVEQLRGCDAVLTSWGVRFDETVISTLDRCVVIGVGSVGVDMVDVEAATAAGIVVTNVPDVFIDEVADHTMMLLLAAARRVTVMDRMVRSGDWWKGRPLFDDVPRIFGQTLGLVSFGNVARAVAARAQPFGLRVIAHDPYVSELEITRAGVEPVELDELLERSDFVSLHPALNEETRHLIDAPALRRMKPGAVLVNTGRGPLVDQDALVDALRAGEIALAALDVLEREPPADGDAILELDNVILTPHSASATARMRPATRRRAAREVALVLSGRWPRSCVNPTVLPRVALERWQPVSMERGPNR